MLDAFDDPSIQTITLCAPTQIGKTLTMIAAMVSACVQDPGPAMLVGPERDSVITLRNRIYMDCLESPTVAGLIPPKSRWNARQIEIGGSFVYLAWTGSPHRTRMRACRRVFMTELDVYARQNTAGGDPSAAARERVKSFDRHTIFQESNPGGEGSPIQAQYLAGDQRRWICVCPKCGSDQELKFFPRREGNKQLGGVVGYQTEDGGLATVEDARAKAVYVCDRGCELDTKDKFQMVRSGHWQAKRPGGRHASFYLWSLHSPAISIGDVAASYVKHADEGALDDFYCNWLATVRKTDKLLTWQRVARRLEAGHDRGTVPADVWFLTAGVDVQERGVYWLVRGWGDRCESWLIDHGYLRRYSLNESDDLRQLVTSLLQRQFAVNGETPLGARGLKPIAIGIDCNYRTLDVHEFVRTAEDTRVRAIRGDPALRKSLYRTTKLAKSTKGDRYEGGLEVVGINVNHFKDELFLRVHGIGEESVSVLHGHRDMMSCRDYCRQLTNEEKRRKVNRLGRSVTEWVVRTGSIGNHYWDLEVYVRALAEMTISERGLTWQSEHWPKRMAKSRRVETGQGYAAR